MPQDRQGEPDDSRNQRYWRRHARRYDRALGVLCGSFPEVIARTGRAMEGAGEVLEVAAGTGLITAEVAPRVSRLVATDNSEAMLEVLRARVDDLGMENVEVLEADALALHFGDGAFDGFVAANVLHLLPDPGQALAEARRVLRTGGKICVPTFCHGENGLARTLSRLLVLTGFPVVTRFGGDHLRRMVEAAGFEVTADDRVSGLLPVRVVAAHAT